jgi:long-chain fatty acid transport protein
MKKIASFLLIVVLLIPSQAFAVGSGGFENATFSARSLAESNAVTAQADEAAAISYNPAGITQLKGVQVQTSTAFLQLHTFGKLANSSVLQSAGTITPIPTAYATINPGKMLNDRVVLGVGSDSPFGLANKYDSNHPAVHYTGWNNYLKMYTVKPVAAIKLADWLSIGGGPVYYRAFDFGSIQAYPNQLLGAGLPDGQVRLNLKGNSWGWHLGTLIKPHPKHQFGFYFRSPTTLFAKGQAKVENAVVTVDGSTAFERGVTAKLDLPLNFTWAYAFKPTEKTTYEVDFGFTRWSALKRIYFDAVPTGTLNDAIVNAISKLDKDFSNSYSLHLGANHKVTKKFTLRGGFNFYTLAVPNDHYVPAIPDSNSIAFSTGFSYALAQWLQLDTAYYARFWLRRKIDNNLVDALGQSIDGRYFTFGHILMLSLTYKWGAGEGASKTEVKKSESAKPIIVTSRRPAETSRQRSEAMEQELSYKGK